MATRKRVPTGGGPGSNQYGTKGVSRQRPASGRVHAFAAPPPAAGDPSVAELAGKADRRQRRDRGLQALVNDLAATAAPVVRDERGRLHDEHGNLHDGPKGEPAIDLSADGVRTVERFQHGRRHDGPNGEPAIVISGPERTITRRYRAFTSADGFSVTYFHDGVNGEPAEEIAYADGSYRSERRGANGIISDGPAGEPAVIERAADGTERHHHYRNGQPIIPQP